MTRREILLEQASGVTGTDAFNSSAGSPTLDATGKVRGVRSVRCNWATAVNTNVVASGLSYADAYYTFYMLIGAAPAATFRMVQAQNGGTQWDIRMTTTPTLQFRWGSTILYTTPTLSLNTVYRIGVRYKCETSLGAANGIMEVYYATGDDLYGAAKATSSVVTMVTTNAAITSVNFGQSNAAASSGDVYFDDVRFDEAEMPGPTYVVPHAGVPIPFFTF